MSNISWLYRLDYRSDVILSCDDDNAHIRDPFEMHQLMTISNWRQENNFQRHLNISCLIFKCNHQKNLRLKIIMRIKIILLDKIWFFYNMSMNKHFRYIFAKHESMPLAHFTFLKKMISKRSKITMLKVFDDIVANFFLNFIISISESTSFQL